MLTPARVRVAEPALASPRPLSSSPRPPESRTLETVFRLRFESNRPGPVKAREPESKPAPNDTDPPRRSGLPSERSAKPSALMVPPETESVPKPKAESLPSASCPAVTRTPPPKVFAPPRRNLPAPAWTSAPAEPLTAPATSELDAPVKASRPLSTCTIPAPLSDARFAPFEAMSRAWSATKTTAFAGSAPAVLSLSVPAVTLVQPE